MPLSKQATEFLDFLSEHQEFRRYDQLEQDYQGFRARQFWAIHHLGFLDVYPNPPQDKAADREYLIAECQFRISDAGIAYLETVGQKTWEEIRAWLAIVMSAIAAAISIVSIWLQFRR